MRVIVEAKCLREDLVLVRRGGGPDCVQVELVQMHPQEPGEEIQALRREPFELAENHAVGGKGGNDVLVGVGKGLFRIRLQQQSEGSLGDSSGHG